MTVDGKDESTSECMNTDSEKTKETVNVEILISKSNNSLPPSD